MCESSCELVNTVKMTFNDNADKPNIDEVATFVKALNVDHGQIEAAYRMAEEKSLFVKFKSEAAMRNALLFNPEELIFHYANGKEAKVHLSHAQDRVFYVRIYDLPPEVPDSELASVLGKYGKVKRIVREKFPAELNLEWFTGVRGAYMDVKKEIPTSLHFLNRRGNIYYPGNKDKCYHCKEEGHRMDSCPKRKARKQQAKEQIKVVGKKQKVGKQSDDGTYAGAVSTGSAPPAPEESGKKAVEEEVMETDVTPPEAANNLRPGSSKAAMALTTAEISEDEVEENDYSNHPGYQILSSIAEALKKSNEECKRQEEAAKVKSPPRKKQNVNYYKK